MERVMVGDLFERDWRDDEGARESLLELMASFARADCLACIRPRSFPPQKDEKVNNEMILGVFCVGRTSIGGGLANKTKFKAFTNLD